MTKLLFAFTLLFSAMTFTHAETVKTVESPKASISKTLEFLGINTSTEALNNCAYPLGATCCKREGGRLICFQLCTSYLCPIGWDQVN